jgi:aminomethyltransferase
MGIGMAYLPASLARIGEELEIEIRGRRFPATVERKPFHRRTG